MEQVRIFEGVPGNTVKITAGADTAYSVSDLATIKAQDLSGQRAVSILITVETNALRMAFGVDASQTVGHLRNTNDSVQIDGGLINYVSFANATAGSNFVIQVTPFFLTKPVLS